jgi:hypothetical protein
MLFKELAFLGVVLMTAILIRARSVVQVHPGPPFTTSKYASARKTDQAFRDRRNCRPTKRCASESPTWITRNGLPKKTTIDDAEFDGAL